MVETKAYRRFVILQRLNELKKALKRHWSQERQDELDNLKQELNGQE